MKKIIVVHPVKETAMAIKALIEKGGFYVSHICALASSALEISQSLDNGVIVCPFVMKDMSASDMALRLPHDFDVIALSKSGSEQYMGNMITMPIPVNVDDFLKTIGILCQSASGFTKRSKTQEEYISKAKGVLMTVKNMTEPQAHKFLQSESMKTRKNIVQIAMNILDEFTN